MTNKCPNCGELISNHLRKHALQCLNQLKFIRQVTKGGKC